MGQVSQRVKASSTPDTPHRQHLETTDAGALALPSEPVTDCLCISRLTPRAAKGTARERATPATKPWHDFPQAFLDDLLDRLDIVEVIDRRVKLKKAGKNYSACCPFHEERTPSFSVNPERQFYYCFGCGAGGNALGFVMEYERLDFREAVEGLAQSVGLEIPQDDLRSSNEPIQDQNKPLYEALERQQFTSMHSASMPSDTGRELLKGSGPYRRDRPGFPYQLCASELGQPHAGQRH